MPGDVRTERISAAVWSPLDDTTHDLLSRQLDSHSSHLMREFRIRSEAPRASARLIGKLLGLHPVTAFNWSQLAGSDWGSYAAHHSRSHSR